MLNSPGFRATVIVVVAGIAITFYALARHEPERIDAKNSETPEEICAALLAQPSRPGPTPDLVRPWIEADCAEYAR